MLAGTSCQPSALVRRNGPLRRKSGAIAYEGQCHDVGAGSAIGAGAEAMRRLCPNRAFGVYALGGRRKFPRRHYPDLAR